MIDTIKLERQGRVLIVTMNRPAQKNALNHAMYGAMADAIAAAQEDDGLRAIVITAAGDTFTAGNDLGDFARPMPEGKAPVVRFLESLRDADKPLVAAVNGMAVGVGLTMLLHCDLAFASDSASFRAPFARMGLVPEAASSLLLPNALGNAWANDILLAGRTISAGEALSTGLVSRVYPGDCLLPETLQTAAAVAALAPNAVRLTKRLIRSNRSAVARQMQAESVLFAEQLQSAEFAEAASAFMQKREPVFD